MSRYIYLNKNHLSWSRHTSRSRNVRAPSSDCAHANPLEYDRGITPRLCPMKLGHCSRGQQHNWVRCQNLINVPHWSIWYFLLFSSLSLISFHMNFVIHRLIILKTELVRLYIRTWTCGLNYTNPNTNNHRGNSLNTKNPYLLKPHIENTHKA